MEYSFTCPFCPSVRGGENDMSVHMEEFHSETESPSPLRQLRAEEIRSPGLKFGECPVDGCDRRAAPVGPNSHTQLHTGTPSGVRKSGDSESSSVYRPARDDRTQSTQTHDDQPISAMSPDRRRQKNGVGAWGKLLAMPSSTKDPTRHRERGHKVQKRLGTSELGKHANEKRMPGWLESLLRTGSEIRAESIIPVLRQLLEQNKGTKYAYLCHPSVQHISKMRLEGGFCGYRNIQMLVSYIIGARAEGRKHFRKKLPTIFEIQDLIEEAWDRGINAQSRSETGGIRGTRKYIGTSEAQALFRVVDIPCTAQAFADPDPVKVHQKLIESVESYFAGGCSSEELSKVRCTTLPPIYFQHAGHSLTIVGFEKQKHGPSNLLVFDPSRRDSPSISRLAGHEFRHKSPDEPLKAYRRGPRYLWRYREFETLMLGHDTG